MTQINDRLIELLNQSATGGDEFKNTYEFTEEAIQEFADLVIEDTLDLMDLGGQLITHDWRDQELERLKYLISRTKPLKKIRRKHK